MKDKDYLYDNYRLAEFYDDLYDYEEDFVLWQKFIKPGMNILEVACGTGRLTRLLLENCTDIHIDALDYSQEMLDILSAKISSFNVKEGNSISVINGDMRYYSGDKKYDLIIIPSNSLNHIETNGDMEKTLDKMYSLLVEGGIFLFDILNPAFEFLLRKPNVVYDKCVVRKKDREAYFCTYEESEYDYSTQINKVLYTYFYCDKDGNKLEDSIEYKMSINVRLYYPQEMDYYISKTQFKNVQKYDWYDERAFKGKTMEQIFVMQK